ncbi:unnamed protein product [Caenorhabditis angaria]|uniref:Uncharacterized protein n=1 Tax=Caenorhabditis angaria TaxID=860376 RepID=A0A9P1I4I2_9PELO|nr:unnamed protein product [Caenorhabditis angaria]
MTRSFELDKITLFYGCGLLLLFIICSAIFVRRQIVRHRKNVARNRPQIALSSRISSSRAINRRENQLNMVMRLRSENQARLTDCVALQSHSDKPYVHRMIAVDAVTLEIDGQLKRIEGAVHRFPEESTYSYLKRIREKVPSLPLNVVNRISFLQEAARFRPEKFDVEHVMEVRSLLDQFWKIISSEYTFLDEEPDSNTPSGVIASFYQFGQKIMPNHPSSKRRRNKFGGSDGVRLFLSSTREQNRVDEQTSLLSPLVTTDSPQKLKISQQFLKAEDSPRLRRQSESHSKLLP